MAGSAEPEPARKPASRPPWYRRKLLWAGLALLVLAAALRLALTPLATHYARHLLRDLHGYSGTFDDLSLRLFALSVVVTGAAVDQVPASDPQRPFLRITRAHVDLQGRELLKGRLVAKATLFEPRFHVVAGQPGPAAEAAPAPEIPDLASALGEAVPFRVDRLEIRKGELTVVDAGSERRPALRLDEIEATVENIESGTQLGNRRPSVFAARARVASSGELSLFYTANLLARHLTFAGRSRIAGLKLTDLNPLITPRTGLKFTDGEFEAFTAFTARDGKLAGGVKPFLKKASAVSVDQGFLGGLKEGMVDTVLAIFSDRVPGREALAGILPIRGQVRSPDVQVLPAVLSVVHNAFVEGLAASFSNLPPPGGQSAGALSGALGVFAQGVDARLTVEDDTSDNTEARGR
jgi:hypothetical protein